MLWISLAWPCRSPRMPQRYTRSAPQAPCTGPPIILRKESDHLGVAHPAFSVILAPEDKWDRQARRPSGDRLAQLAVPRR